MHQFHTDLYPRFKWPVRLLWLGNLVYLLWLDSLIDLTGIPNRLSVDGLMILATCPAVLLVDLVVWIWITLLLLRKQNSLSVELPAVMVLGLMLDSFLMLLGILSTTWVSLMILPVLAPVFGIYLLVAFLLILLFKASRALRLTRKHLAR